MTDPTIRTQSLRIRMNPHERQLADRLRQQFVMTDSELVRFALRHLAQTHNIPLVRPDVDDAAPKKAA